MVSLSALLLESMVTTDAPDEPDETPARYERRELPKVAEAEVRLAVSIAGALTRKTPTN